MEERMRQRINDLFLHYGTNLTRFSNGDTALQNRLSRQLNQGASITYDTIARVLDAYPEVSAEWLLRGKGEMLSPTCIHSNAKECGHKDNINNAILETIVNEIIEQRKMFQSQIDRLISVIEKLQTN